MVKIIRHPDELGYTLDNIEFWRNQIRVERRYQCEDCGGFGGEIHESILTRKDVMGFKPERAIRVFSDCNLSCLCRPCHEKRHGTKDHRAVAWQKACETYGHQAMIDWYVSFGWKTMEARFKRCCDESAGTQIGDGVVGL